MPDSVFIYKLSLPKVWEGVRVENQNRVDARGALTTWSGIP